MCPDCYDYESAVLFNAYAGDLWRRFVTYLPRHLARLAGVTQKTLRAQLRIRFVKVAEYQARGVVHFHAVIRLDAPGEDYQPPPPRTPPTCCATPSTRPPPPSASSSTTTARPSRSASARRPIPASSATARQLPGTGQALNGQAVANYIAKYATKTLTAPGLPSQRLRRETDLGQLRCSAHYRRLITTAWQLGGTRPTARFRAWAHMLGYGGHFLTKSRRYSVTFGQLRTARADHRRATRPLAPGRDAWDRSLDETVVLVLGTTWSYAGVGHATPAAELAAASAARAREHSRPGRSRLTIQCQPVLDSKPANRRRRDNTHESWNRPAASRLEEAADVLGTKPRFTRRLVAERRIRFTHVGRHVRIPESALREFIRGRNGRAGNRSTQRGRAA